MTGCVKRCVGGDVCEGVGRRRHARASRRSLIACSALGGSATPSAARMCGWQPPPAPRAREQKRQTTAPTQKNTRRGSSCSAPLSAPRFVPLLFLCRARAPCLSLLRLSVPLTHTLLNTRTWSSLLIRSRVAAAGWRRAAASLRENGEKKGSEFFCLCFIALATAPEGPAQPTPAPRRLGDIFRPASLAWRKRACSGYRREAGPGNRRACAVGGRPPARAFGSFSREHTNPPALTRLSPK